MIPRGLIHEKSIRLLVICKPSSASPVVSGSAVVRHKKEAKKTIVVAGPFDLNTVMNVNNASRSTGSRVFCNHPFQVIKNTPSSLTFPVPDVAASFTYRVKCVFCSSNDFSVSGSPPDSQKSISVMH